MTAIRVRAEPPLAETELRALQESVRATRGQTSLANEGLIDRQEPATPTDAPGGREWKPAHITDRDLTATALQFVLDETGKTIITALVGGAVSYLRRRLTNTEEDRAWAVIYGPREEVLAKVQIRRGDDPRVEYQPPWWRPWKRRTWRRITQSYHWGFNESIVRDTP